MELRAAYPPWQEQPPEDEAGEAGEATDVVTAGARDEAEAVEEPLTPAPPPEIALPHRWAPSREERIPWKGKCTTSWTPAPAQVLSSRPQNRSHNMRVEHSIWGITWRYTWNRWENLRYPKQPIPLCWNWKEESMSLMKQSTSKKLSPTWVTRNCYKSACRKCTRWSTGSAAQKWEPS